jgi:xylulose-5-phosphate/fructose-6-phosphate phosphoketolase
MPGQKLAQSNPPPDPSNLPEMLGELAVKLKLDVLSKDEVQSLKNFRATANYIAAGNELFFQVIKSPTHWIKQ